MLDSPAVLELLARQYWLVELTQLTGLGISPRTIARARQKGILVPTLPGVLRMTSAPLTYEARAMALQLYAGGEPSFLSGPTAANLLGLRGMPRSYVEVTVHYMRRLVLPRWARSVRSSWIDDGLDIVERPDGLRIAHPLRMLFGVAGSFGQHRLERAAEDAWHLGLIRPDDAAEYLQRVRRSGRGGVARYERWLERALTRARAAQSHFEMDVIDAVRRSGLPEPERQHELTLPGGETIHVDLAWPKVRLGVEPGHTWWHGGDLGAERDAARDRACDVIGWRILRYTEAAREDLAAVAREIAAVYRERERTLRPSA